MRIKTREFHKKATFNQIIFFDKNNTMLSKENYLKIKNYREIKNFLIISKNQNNKILRYNINSFQSLILVEIDKKNTNIDNELSEDDLYNLELEAFMRLIQMPKTQERIKHTLETGKPLVN